ncbi:MAG TPA: rhamnogalacturonan acetylesterase [Tepidisphaeraceae bacterium]
MNRRSRSCFLLLLCSLTLALSLTSLVSGADDNRPIVNDAKFGADVRAVDKLPTLFLVGDSTVNTNGKMRGWGQEIGGFFDPAKIHIVNRAIGGRSSRTYRTEGKWARVLDELRPGDVVLIQFGHNDVGRYDDPKAKGRPSLHGEGNDTADLKKPDGSTETVHAFGWYMRQYCTEAKAKGATVILCSMVPHKDWTPDSKISRRERDTFVMWTENAARATGAQFIDLNEIVAERYEKLGKEKVETFFADQRTHTTPEGAKFTAEAVIAGLKSLQPDPLSGDFSAAGGSVRPAQLATEAQ